MVLVIDQEYQFFDQASYIYAQAIDDVSKKNDFIFFLIQILKKKLILKKVKKVKIQKRLVLG